MTIFHTPTPHGQRVVGELVKGEFRKVVHRSKHFLTAPPAIALDASVCDQLAREFCHIIRIKEMEEREFWEVPFNLFLKHKFQVDRGHGRQYALTLDWWTIRDADGVMRRKGKDEPPPRPKLGGEEQRQEVEALLTGWRPTIGNERDINIMKMVGRLRSQYNRKTKNKKDIDDLEKQIIRELAVK